jgi:hypothetical protein
MGQTAWSEEALHYFNVTSGDNPFMRFGDLTTIILEMSSEFLSKQHQMRVTSGYAGAWTSAES